MIKNLYDRWILEYPRFVLTLLVLVIALLGYEARNLEVDASAETLVLEDDKDLRLTREVNARYGSPDYLIITYTPKEDLLSASTLKNIKALKDELTALEGVESVVSILDVPLLESPPMPVKEMVNNVRTLESPETDMALARKEFLTSPIYRDLMVSPDFKTTALQVNLPENELFRKLLNRRNELKQKQKDGDISATGKLELKKVLADFKVHRDKIRLKQHEDIALIRNVMNGYRDDAELFLGGVSMVSDDLITYVKNDLKIFGTGVMFFLVITLWIIFRQLRWIFIPILCCAFSVICTAGLLGMFGWEVTVISSNFISIQIIITMAVTIHLIVRYRELLADNPDSDQRRLILDTITSMAKPCFYAIVTTMAGFSSLILSNILPVINFGWMMSAGIGVSLLLTFLIFPTLLMLMGKTPPNTAFESHFVLTKLLARYTETHGKPILWLSAALLLVSITGASKLIVENSFIDYFKDTTEIYQGMSVIDRQLGGTTPLDVVVDFKEPESEPNSEIEADPAKADSIDNAGSNDEFDDDFDDFEEEFEAEKGKAQYWFTSRRMEEVEKIHDYLDSVPETGKVMSLGTMLKVGRTINDGESLDNFKLALIYNKLPEKFRKIILTPYVSIEDNQVRFSVRVRDSDKDLRRNELLKRIRRDMSGKLGISEERVKLTGLMVLYNNMLQSLFNSQILTLGAVVVVLMLMFMLLFRSIKIAFIAIAPNLLSVGTVLGFMGWAGIPLDMMTITIAAISVGIAVDDTIHYIHRFRKEFALSGSYIDSMHRCHSSIAYAMYYTSVTIIIGFSILIFSNFIPSIYFGLLTGLAMVIALISALTLLPRLIISLRPFGPEKA